MARFVRFCVVVGTRPEIIKMASVVHELRSRGQDFAFIHTGQHYDSVMSAIFLRELELPNPELNLETGSGSQAEQTATALVRLEEAFLRLRPDVVIVEGDTNTAVAAALAAAKLGIDVGHVEAGVRSYDLRMPEEHNRRLADHLSAYLFAPSERAAATLRDESCWGRVYVTGNTVIDAVVRYGRKAATAGNGLFDALPREFALATGHRAENVDDVRVLRELCEVFARCPLPVVYPIHPRTRKRLQSAGLEAKLSASGNVTLLPPVGYLEFLRLLTACRFVLTDSGGIQQEVTAPNLQKKVFVLRETTESTEAVEAGYAEVVGTRADSILGRLERFLSEGWTSPGVYPYGQGDAGRRIVDILEKASPGLMLSYSRRRLPTGKRP